MRKFKIVMSGLLLATTLLFTGCDDTAGNKRYQKDQESNQNGGLNRVVTVYTPQGEALTSYEGLIDIDTNNAPERVKFDIDYGEKTKRIIIYKMGDYLVIAEEIFD